ncbi:MAG: hypothetical protein KIS79_15700, partial [Burkholderiales bacterium]|nr:hypothetical protein [Burkholderiales bacterium]
MLEILLALALTVAAVATVVALLLYRRLRAAGVPVARASGKRTDSASVPWQDGMPPRAAAIHASLGGEPERAHALLDAIYA